MIMPFCIQHMFNSACAYFYTIFSKETNNILPYKHQRAWLFRITGIRAHFAIVKRKEYAVARALMTRYLTDNNHKTDIESLIRTLLAAGADTALKNDRGETALHESLECGALNTATLLIQHTPTGITSRYGETPLHIASRKNHVDMVTKLLENGEDPGTQDAGGNTPLHLASARGFHQTVSLLVTSPLAQLEKINIDGLTALQVAAESGFVNAVRILFVPPSCLGILTFRSWSIMNWPDVDNSPPNPLISYCIRQFA